jgi:hypothetical protein
VPAHWPLVATRPMATYSMAAQALGQARGSRLGSLASGAGVGAERLPPLNGRNVSIVDVGDRGGKGGGREGDGDQTGGERWSSSDIGAIISADRKGRGDGGVDDGSVDGSDVGDVVTYERGETRRLEGSLLSLSSSTSQRLFLVCFAGGDFGGGDSAVGSDSAVD